MVYDPGPSGCKTVDMVHAKNDLIQGGSIHVKCLPAAGTELEIAVDGNNGIGDSLKPAGIILIAG
jgi:hypothetical protein